MRLLPTALLAALVPIHALAAFHSNQTACTRTYTVVDGDTCNEIGQKTLTSTFQIMALNLLDAGKDCYSLQIGAKLCLGRFGNDCQFVHRVTKHDTCHSIANAYGISIHCLKDNNPILDCNAVYDGLVLCVTNGSVRPPADNSINSTAIQIQHQQYLEKQQRTKQLHSAQHQNANNKSNTNSSAKYKQINSQHSKHSHTQQSPHHGEHKHNPPTPHSNTHSHKSHSHSHHSHSKQNHTDHPELKHSNVECTQHTDRSKSESHDSRSHRSAIASH